MQKTVSDSRHGFKFQKVKPFIRQVSLTLSRWGFLDFGLVNTSLFFFKKS